MIARNKRRAALLKELRSIHSGEWTPLDAAKNNAGWQAQLAARHAQNAQYFAGCAVALDKPASVGASPNDCMPYLV